MRKYFILIIFAIAISTSCIKVYHEEVKKEVKTKQQIVAESKERQESTEKGLIIIAILLAPFGLLLLFSKDDYPRG